ncbi:hypothetical protein KCP69_19470 [Salmonella enterica subsp. enterica]|nr:hypothetical protein KCP69_19470 [Salmonella enterica subsp. enterica]
MPRLHATLTVIIFTWAPPVGKLCGVQDACIVWRILCYTARIPGFT